MRIKRSWAEFKDLIEVKNLPIQYKVDGLQYFIWVNESNDTYYCNINIESGNTDQADFENNYKTNANQPIAPHSLDGKEIVRSESKPLNYTTVFLTRSDSRNCIMNFFIDLRPPRLRNGLRPLKRERATLFLIHLVLICKDNGIACLNTKEINMVLDTECDKTQGLSASRRPREKYKVSGSLGSIKYKFGDNEFPDKIF